MSAFDKLELSTETLRDLTDGELTTVAGGAPMWTPACPLIIELTEPVRETTNLTQVWTRGADG